MKLVGVPKKWLKDKKCDPAIVDESKVVDSVLSSDSES